MKSGAWKIVIQGNQVAVQRTIQLTVGVPVTSTLTVCKIPCWNPAQGNKTNPT